MCLYAINEGGQFSLRKRDHNWRCSRLDNGGGCCRVVITDALRNRVVFDIMMHRQEGMMTRASRTVRRHIHKSIKRLLEETDG
jgi:hypothetical protein